MHSVAQRLEVVLTLAAAASSRWLPPIADNLADGLASGFSFM